MTSENSRRRGENPSCSGMIVRRIIRLPRSILGGFSRAMGNGVNFMGLGERRSHIQPPSFQPFSQYYDPESSAMMNENDEWSFFNNFEQNYGATHPCFYACRFIQALKIAQDENKFLFVYLHSLNHPFAPDFCRKTLCSELVIQFLDANFISWGAISDRGEGLMMREILRPASFPFCAVIAPASAHNIALLQQIEGPVSPAELVEILQRTLEEQGVAFGSARLRATEEEKRRTNRRLREEQDAASLAALKLDQERERVKSLPEEKTVVQSPPYRGFSQWPRQNPNLIKPSHVKEVANKREQEKDSANKTKNNQVIKILIRFPNGERRECSLKETEKVKAIYKYIESLGLPGIVNYRLISNFPRRVYGADQMGMTLKDAGLYPKPTLFLELL